MSKIRTLSDLQTRLDTDFGWRLKELSNLKTLINGADGVSRSTAIRASVCVAYAHWEGFVKESSESYVRYVANRKLSFQDLADPFVALGAKHHVEQMLNSRSAAAAVSMVDFFRSKMLERPRLKIAGLVRTESNLNSKVLEDILILIGLDVDAFASRNNQIDKELLGRRNKIAHGERLDLEPEQCKLLIEDVISCLRQFKTMIENAASSKSFKRNLKG